ncbi:MAG TPA: type II secretion system protein GspN [Geobacteraceae bacterium]|nr:type II secretion system protein GspN [Geobacteraceae bacterium]
MRLRKYLFIAVISAGALIVFPFITLLLVPSAEIKGVIVRGVAKNGYVMTTEQFGKAFPLGIKARNAVVSDGRGTLLKLDRASIYLKLLPLCIGRVVVDFRMQIKEGEGHVEFRPRQNSVSVQLENILLEDIPLLEVVTGANIKGRLYVDGSFAGRGRKTEGALKMEVRKAELSAIKIGEIPLPDASYETIRGMFRVASRKGTLESFAFQGQGIYIRIKGSLPVSGPLARAPLDLVLELMPKPDFLERQKLVFMMLAKYQKSPGSYRIPIKGVLMKPVIQ